MLLSWTAALNNLLIFWIFADYIVILKFLFFYKTIFSII